jgi:hypothetical protein
LGYESWNWELTSSEVREGKMKFVPQTPGYVADPNSAPDSSTPSHLKPVAAALVELVVFDEVVEVEALVEVEVVDAFVVDVVSVLALDVVAAAVAVVVADCCTLDVNFKAIKIFYDTYPFLEDTENNNHSGTHNTTPTHRSLRQSSRHLHIGHKRFVGLGLRQPGWRR